MGDQEATDEKVGTAEDRDFTIQSLRDKIKGMKKERLDIANDFQVKYNNLRQQNQNKMKGLITQNQEKQNQQKMGMNSKTNTRKRKMLNVMTMTVIGKQEVETASIYDKTKKPVTLVEQIKYIGQTLKCHCRDRH